MWVKICGNTNLEDALLAVEAGADAVGFVFAKSPRQVTPAQAAGITAGLPDSIERVGVLSSVDAEEIVSVVQEAGLTGVQLHGGEAAGLAAALRRRLPEGTRLVQTNHWRVGGQALNAFAAEMGRLRETVEIDAVLVDSRTAVADGGTGVTFDWSAAREALEALGDKRLIVAGGLTPNNVATAIQVLRPWGVDVASGVEASPGRKDAGLVKAFVYAAKAGRAPGG